jgi:hypothetical protein
LNESASQCVIDRPLSRVSSKKSYHIILKIFPSDPENTISALIQVTHGKAKRDVAAALAVAQRSDTERKVKESIECVALVVPH